MNISNHLSGPKLAIICGIPERTAGRILAEANVQRHSDGYDAREALRAIVAHYRDASERINVDMEKDRAAKLKAERDIAEIQAAKLKGELVLADDIVPIWTDGIIELRQVVERADYIPMKDRLRLNREMCKVRLDSDALEEAGVPAGPQEKGKRSRKL